MLRFILTLLCLGACCHAAGPDVLTHHNDNLRTGANLNETILTPANVNYRQFGKLFDHPVDGYVYAQPLYVSGVDISGTIHNVVFVATEHDSVFAFDADNNTGSNATPLWQTPFIDPADGITTVPSADVGSDDIYPEIGITSTPVIDSTTGTIYVVAKTKENGSYYQRLHALDITTGLERADSPVTITGTVAGSGVGNVNGIITFDALTENQRAGLLLLNGVVYIAWSSHGDNNPVHGWVIGYNEESLARVSVFNTTPDGSLATIWMSGCGPSADATGNIYFSTGNGDYETNKSGHHIGNDYGDSLLKLSSSNNSLSLADYFTPINQNYLNNHDVDFGSGGVLLLPDQPGAHPHLGVITGKQNITFVFDRDHLGGYTPGNEGVYESIPGAIIGSFGTPAYFNGRIYYHGSNYSGDDVLKAFDVRDDRVVRAPASRGMDVFPYPGSTPSITASGTTNGIVWEIEHTSPASLFASNADDVSQRLYTSNDAGTRDNPAGNAVKFTVPTITNGKVYIGTASSLSVFALLSDTTPLTVNINGPGIVTSGFAGASERETNSSLIITATASPGAVFVGWTDAGGKLITVSPTYSFAMQENLVLNANFRVRPIPGTYSGLIQGASPSLAATGYMRLSAAASGVFTASIRFGGRIISLHGNFDDNGQFTTTLDPNTSESTVISLVIDGFGNFTGAISTQVTSGSIAGAALVTAANPISANLIGKYTLLFPVPADPTAPQGIGYGSATVDGLGHVRLVGLLGDGVAFTQGATVTQAGTWPLFTRLYAGKGVLAGILTFENNGGLSNLDGPLFWFKPRPGSTPLSGLTDAIGSLYQSANPILPLTSGTGTLTLQLPTAISQTVTAGSGLGLSGPGPLTLIFNPTTGLFHGTFSAGGGRGEYGAAIYQDQNLGEGTYILSGTTGAVNLQ
jgi:hypothetical protein